jgi:hypothetical protein
MELDPHTLQQIIQRIYQQMRCPQCGKRIPVDFTSVRLAGDDFMLLQLKYEAAFCDGDPILGSDFFCIIFGKRMLVGFCFAEQIA